MEILGNKLMFACSLSLVLVIMLTLGPSVEARAMREKRSLFQLCELINFHTNRSCADFNDYGCFCGYGQEGRKPMDEVDACCKKHDNCYGKVDKYCSWFPQFLSFDVKCNENTKKCRCYDDRGTCRREVCECEVDLAECLGRSKYHNLYYHMDRSWCTPDNSVF